MCLTAEGFKLLERKWAMTEEEVEPLFKWLDDNKFISKTSYEVWLEKMKWEDTAHNKFIWKRECVWPRIRHAENLRFYTPVRTTEDDAFDNLTAKYKV